MMKKITLDGFLKPKRRTDSFDNKNSGHKNLIWRIHVELGKNVHFLISLEESRLQAKQC